MKKILRRIAKKLRGSKPPAPQSEEAYYEKLFTENAQWNKPVPNDEEAERWMVIEEFIKYAVAEHAKQGNANLNILDVGCGRGWLSNLLSSYGTVTGIEPVKKVVEFGRKLFPGLNLLNGTTQTLLQQPGHDTYDIIVSSEVIEHIPDEHKNGFIGDIKQLLKPGGFVILTTPRKEAQGDWMKHQSPDQPIEDWISEADLEGLLHQNDFSTCMQKRLAASPANGIKIDIYQLWLFQQK